jgi:uncharacterized NAD-dependent epimerase/dehydratase family protein
MTHDPVDLDARRATTAQEIDANRRQCLKDFQHELATLKRDQKQFTDRLSATIAQFQSGGARATDRTSPRSLPLQHASWVQPKGASAPPASVLTDAPSSIFGQSNTVSLPASSNVRTLPPPASDRSRKSNVEATSKTAIVYCESNFGKLDGKTANGLVRHSEEYEILAIIDSEKANLDAGVVLDDKANGIPICDDLADALCKVGDMPDVLIYGMAPSSGMLSQDERIVVLDAIGIGINIVCGLHEFLSDDPEFVEAGRINGVQITDVRKPPAKTDLRPFSGRIREVTCPRIAVLGTDCAIGKRTTASILTRLLGERGVNAVMVGTGQTGLMQGARYGVALDAVPSQFCSGELEAVIVEAFERQKPDIIIIEGQGALSHPAFSTSAFILRGSQPDGVILQHAPGRAHRCDFEDMPMPTLQSEINLIQAFSDTKVIGITINHENMTDAEVDAAISAYEGALDIPATDALSRSPERLIEMVVATYPQLREKLNVVLQ